MKGQCKNRLWILSFAFLTLTVKAQIFPADKLALRYTQIMFEYPQVPNAEIYKIEIAANNASDFDKALVYSSLDSSTAHLLNSGVVNFGSKYKWHYLAYNKGKQIYKSKDFSFDIIETNLVINFRLNAIVYDSSKIENGLILLDNGVVIDRKGNLVLVSDSFGVEKRDFSLTPQGTLTYIQTAAAYERNLNGDLIWKTNEIKTEKELIYGYHHDLIKLNNGNYLVMCKVKELNNPSSRKQLDEGIVELDKNNKIIWLWKECTEISDTSSIKHTHLNSIFLNEERNKLFVSGRDINTIFRIDRATSKIESCIGTLLNIDSEYYPQNLFSGQHSAQLLSNGNILLFNNNAKMGKNGMSSILEINQPNRKSSIVTPKFSYLYMFDNPEENFCAKGGDVNKLKNGNYLISSSANNRNFEITSAKKIVWQCRPEKLDTVTKLWVPAGSYRINYAESLYPYYFTAHCMRNNSKTISFKITNEGSSDDVYEIVMKDSKGNILKQDTLSISRNKSSIINIGKETSSCTQISITSSNSSISKTIACK